MANDPTQKGEAERVRGPRNRTGLIAAVIVVFVIAGAVAAMWSQRPSPPGPEQKTTTGQTAPPASAGGVNDPRPR
jgi:cell division protein FtsN